MARKKFRAENAAGPAGRGYSAAIRLLMQITL